MQSRLDKSETSLIYHTLSRATERERDARHFYFHLSVKTAQKRLIIPNLVLTSSLRHRVNVSKSKITKLSAWNTRCRNLEIQFLIFVIGNG